MAKKFTGKVPGKRKRVSRIRITRAKRALRMPTVEDFLKK